jgi:hypothetical protein
MRVTASLAALLLFGLATLSPANALTTISVGGGPLSGSQVEDFEGLPLGPASGAVVGGTIAGGDIVQPPSVGGVYAVPVGSTGHFLNVLGGSYSTITFDKALSSLGLLWGSVDAYNTIEFFGTSGLIAVFTGTDVLNPANGDQGPSGTSYVNFFFSNHDVTSVKFSSSSNSFELDNVSIHPVPLPAALPLLVAGLVGLGFVGRRSNKAA